MILYDPLLPVSLAEFGIQIPLSNSRVVKTYKSLCADPKLGPEVRRWHVAAIDERLGREDLLRVHTPSYVAQLYSPGLETQIVATYELIDSQGNYYRYAPAIARCPLSELFGRILITAAGTLQCARMALEHGFCFYFSGGMHHAHGDHGSGFCLINDVVIAVRRLQQHDAIGRVWVIDVDAHKGDGTAALTADDPSIATLSIHMAAGWPLDRPRRLASGKRNPVFTPSTIDIPVGVGEDEHYVARLEGGLRYLDQLPRPDLSVVLCGADPYQEDALASTADLRLSLAQLFARDRLVYHFLKKRSIPAAFLMAGGYGEKVWKVYLQFLRYVLYDRLMLTDSTQKA
jgi:acetoin utilization deacetylase AcuC-like enzyme